MAEEVVLPSGDALAAPGSAPVVAAETVTPVVAPGEASPTSEVVVESAPAADVAEPVVLVEETPEAAPEAEKPVEAAPAEDAVEAVKPEPIQYEEFKLPEGLQAAPEQLEQFTGVLNELGLTQEQGQKLMDLHGSALAKAAEVLAQRQTDVFAETQQSWQKDFFKTAGNRANTTLEEARTFLAAAVPDAKKRAEVWDVLAFTGAGNHKAIINAMAAGGRRLSERSAPAAPVPNSNGAGDAAWNKRYSRSQS